MGASEVVGAPLDGEDAPWPAVEATRRASAVADLAVAGLYVPAGQGREPIAGDFFDVLDLGPDLVALTIGDVSGHGTPAVGRMRVLRSTAYAYALEGGPPSRVLARLDAFMARQGEDELATVWHGQYRPSTGQLTYGSAGHPPPALHVHGQGAVLLALADAPPLGSGLAHDLAQDRTVVLPPGAVLVAYSDGLVERRRADFEEQLAVLTAIVDRACDPARDGRAEQIAAEILATLVPDPDRAEDDVCLLVVRRQPG